MAYYFETIYRGCTLCMRKIPHQHDGKKYFEKVVGEDVDIVIDKREFKPLVVEKINSRLIFPDRLYEDKETFNEYQKLFQELFSLLTKDPITITGDFENNLDAMEFVFETRWDDENASSLANKIAKLLSPFY